MGTPLGNPEDNRQIIQQGDIATRLRRFTRGVGNLGTFLDLQVHPEISIADVSKDPYQNEWNSFASPNLQGGAAGNISILALEGFAPVTLVDMIAFVTAAAGNVVVVGTERPTTLTGFVAPGSANLAPFNNGGKGSNLLAVCQAKVSNINQAASPSGQFVENIVGTGATQYWIPPYPVVLYGPPFSGSNAVGDCLFVNSFAANQAIRCTFYFREYPQIAPN